MHITSTPSAVWMFLALHEQANSMEPSFTVFSFVYGSNWKNNVVFVVNKFCKYNRFLVYVYITSTE